MFLGQGNQQPERRLADYQQELYDKLGTTVLHPVGAVFFGLMTLWTFLVPRCYVIWALLFTACFISPGQRFAFFTIDFHFQRAIIVVILFRILIMSEFQGIKLRGIDYAIFGCALSLILATLLGGRSQFFLPVAGRAADGIGIYLIARAYVRQLEDLRAVLLGAAIAAVPVMIGFIIEKSTTNNMFSVFGGVPPITVLRDGKLRAQGAYTHPIIAGAFWATFVPLFFAVVLAKARTIRAVITGWVGTISAVIAALMTASSTPIGGLLIGFGTWCLFPFRGHLRIIRWGVFFVLVSLHLLSDRGVHGVIFTKFNFIAASTGYHRYQLIQGAIDGFSQWALLGHRGTHFNRAYDDVTNDYIALALNGGLAAVVLKITAIVLAFISIGKLMRAVQNNRSDLFLAYGLGAALLTVTITMLAVSMYHQGEIPVFLTLGMAASLGDPQWLPGMRNSQAPMPMNTPSTPS